MEEFVEAPAAFTPPAPDTVGATSERYALRGNVLGAWTSVQRIRLREDDVADAVEAARAFMREAGTTHASWWLSERSTPADVEERLLACGLAVVPDDYLIDGLLLTHEPPHGPPDVEVRPVASAAEYVAVTEAQYEAFGTHASRRRDAASLVHEWELIRRSDVVVPFAAWLDGRLAAGARAVFSPRGALLSGGSTVPWARGRGAYRALVRARWDAAAARGTPALAVQAGSQSAPILRRLGFEHVVQFRRLQDVLSPG